ncbi:MAG: hypothetical protein AAFN70_10485, partial [Planctomycetota bacterium]
MSDHGILKYNGYTFGPHSHVRIETTMVESDDGRTISHHKHLITVQAIITPNDGQTSTDQSLESIRNTLSVQGQHLVVQGKGWGDIDVNGASTGLRDVEFGPKPKVIRWTPVGHDQAAEITWQVETCVPACEDGISVGIMGFVFEMSFALNRKGYTTRTVNGHLKIAMTRSGRNIPDTADAYRDQINVVGPDNFRRDRQDFRLSSDKRTLNFSIVDSEIESRNPYPAGCTEIRAEHSVEYARRRGKRHDNRIAVQISLAPDQPALRAWEVFRLIVNSRLENAGIEEEQSHKPYINGLTATEDIFGDTYAFAVDYELTAKISELFTATGIFSQLPTTSFNWADWKSSMAFAEGNRGRAELFHIPQMDRIVDLCDSNLGGGGYGSSTPLLPPIGNPPTLCNETPSPENSWLRFHHHLTEETTHSKIFKTTLGRA